MFPDHSFFDPRTVSDMPYKKMAEIERNWLDQSDIVFAYLNESNPYGYGTCFEIGYAVAKKKMIIYIILITAMLAGNIFVYYYNSREAKLDIADTSSFLELDKETIPGAKTKTSIRNAC